MIELSSIKSIVWPGHVKVLLLVDVVCQDLSYYEDESHTINGAPFF